LAANPKKITAVPPRFFAHYRAARETHRTFSRSSWEFLQKVSRSSRDVSKARQIAVCSELFRWSFGSPI